MLNKDYWSSHLHEDSQDLHLRPRIYEVDIGGFSMKPEVKNLQF